MISFFTTKYFEKQNDECHEAATNEFPNFLEQSNSEAKKFQLK